MSSVERQIIVGNVIRDFDESVVIGGRLRVCLALDKLDIAERYTEKELELSDGKKWEAHRRMGHIRLLQGDWKSALGCYDKYIILFSKDFDGDTDIPLAKLTQSQEMLVEKGIKREDLLLIHDILQASTDNSVSQNPPHTTES